MSTIISQLSHYQKAVPTTEKAVPTSKKNGGPSKGCSGPSKGNDLNLKKMTAVQNDLKIKIKMMASEMI